MQKNISSETFNRVVKDQEIWNFEIEENAVYTIAITAKCKNWAQNIRRLFNDDDLAIQIDSYIFSEISGKKREFDGAGSWNGNELKNISKQVLYVLPLKSGSHKVTFWVGESPFVEKIEIRKFEGGAVDLLGSNIAQSQNFLDIIVKNVPVQDFKVVAKADENSDLEILVDGQVQENPRYKRYKKWYWYGGELKGLEKDYHMAGALDDNKHSIQFFGEGSPSIESINLQINVENVQYTVGYVRLYKDIKDIAVAHLRPTASDKNDDILFNIPDGEKVGIHEERIFGMYIDSLSNIWHEIIYKGTRGFVLSSFIEIEGQERGRIIDLIKDSCQKYGVDPNLMLAIAGQESHFKPYAVSYKKPQGVFQLTEGTATQFNITDRFDFYQNIDCGVRNYKWIEDQIQGRGDMLLKRLVAWHDGLTITNYHIKNKSFDYDKLSEETKSFVASVLANLNKKDWYHIISITIILLLFVTTGCFELIVSNNSNTVTSETANVIAYSQNQVFQVNDESTTTDNLSSVYPDYGKNISSTSAAYYSDTTGFIDDTPHFPEVNIDENSNQVIFINSHKEIVQSIDVKLLNLEDMFGIGDLPGDTIQHHISTSPVVLENPSGVFYFSAVNSRDCGASNCHYILYRYNIHTKKLDILRKDLFGEIMGLYLSPDMQNIIWTAESSAGTCFGSSSAGLVNLSDFKQNVVIDPEATTANLTSITHVQWENSHTVQFVIDYWYGDDCIKNRFTEVHWSYDINDHILTKLKSESVQASL